MASLVAASAVADRKLLANFSAWAMPGCRRRGGAGRSSPARTGSTARQAASVPAYMTESVRALAPATPPETGAST